MNYKVTLIGILLLLPLNFLFAEISTEKLENLMQNEVLISLQNGDKLTGIIKVVEREGDSAFAISVQTSLGKAKIFMSEIKYIQRITEINKQSHRIFILPTAEPIGKNHFIGNFELLFFYAGIGISDYFSLTAGRSIIPGSSSEFQITELNAKATVYRHFWESDVGNMSVAVGMNYALLNSNNKLSHIYTSLTFVTTKSVFTGSVYSKIGTKDFYEFRLSNGVDISTYPFVYENGAFGIALGFDTRFASSRDVHIIGELWNSNISAPSNTGILLGVRLAGTKLSADFGLALFTSPILMPFTSFVWTPF
jgi:hypothetical protein